MTSIPAAVADLAGFITWSYANEVPRTIGGFKTSRAVATRYDKRANGFRSTATVSVSAIRLWLGP
ncbi:hypothetical protein ACFTZH_13315 [Streptomyces fimicarius]|uniref:hypothetical protein n=1 Tax=Streptomyces griseus TaxID=1911 RepID=UPI00362C5706